MRKILCYELNEVPWRVIDFYIKNRKKSNLEKLIKDSTSFTSHTKDSGELHPWTTWPTTHRGVSNHVHNIRFLNQDLSNSSNFPPIWDIIINANKTVGIFGSLQSGKPILHENMKFHIPDTFSSTYETKPKKYELFQKFNLSLTNRNKATASKISFSDFIHALKLFQNGLTLKTSIVLLKHLMNELRNECNKSLRPTMQADVAFDIFKDCLKKTKPDFVTFFTNHVAGIMHRYWKYSFPEDFNYRLSSNSFDQFHKDSILKSMEIADRQIGFLMKFTEKNNYDLIVCSSMGQEAIDRGEYIPEIKIDNFEKLTSVINYVLPIKMHMAMQPDIVFQFEDTESLRKFTDKIITLTDTANQPIFKERYAPENLTLNLESLRSKTLVNDSKILFKGTTYTLKTVGLSIFKRDIGTGYHQPYGTIIWRNNYKNTVKERKPVDACSLAPSILQTLKIPTPKYMNESFLSKH